MNPRHLQSVIDARPASDGAGVKLYRAISPDRARQFDPFLLLDEFGSDEAADYIAGFPSHPHRGFETVTYMLEGEMLHEDHLGNRGRLSSGSVQWMTAGRGVVHSEMPQQTEGRMHGFQLWINLPAAEKMKDAAYQDIPSQDIPSVALSGGGTVRVVAGRFQPGDEAVLGAVQGVSTDPLYLDLQLVPGEGLEVPLPAGHRALLYVYTGALQTGGRRLQARQLGVLGDGDGLSVQAGDDGGRALLLAARPLGEPIAHYGPFVMNTREELEQAMRDYQAGRLTA